MMPKLVVLQSRKRLHVLERNASSLLVQVNFSKRCAKIVFKINGSRDILTW